jgi:hypothetical protein
MVPWRTLTPGSILRGKVSWFGGPNDPTSGPTTASGSPISAGGIAVYNEATLGGYWQVTFPNGRTEVLKQTDIGPAPYTGRVVDVAYSSLAGAGYTEGNFPTNGSVQAVYLGKGAAAGDSAAAAPFASAAGPQSTETGPGGLVGTGTKAFLYLALILGGAAALWLGTKTALQPRQAK